MQGTPENGRTEKPRLEYFLIDRGGRASLNKMYQELPITADLAIKRMQDKDPKRKVVGQAEFNEQGQFDIFVFRPDLQEHGETRLG